MAKKNKSKSKPKLPDVLIESTKTYKNTNKLTVVEGIIGTHTIHRTAGNEKAAMNKVQRAFNEWGQQMLVNKFETLPRSRSEANRRGTSRYLTGKACCNGHIAERYTDSGGCVTCVKIRSHAAKHPDEYINKTRQRIEALKEKPDFEESW